MKRFLVCMAVIAGLAFMCSCEEKKYGHLPVYGSISLDPADPQVGDSVTATVEILKQGEYIYRADYKWTLDGKTFEQTGVLDPLEKDIQFGFRATAGTHTIGCRAVKLYFSRTSDAGQLYGNASAKDRTFTISSK